MKQWLSDFFSDFLGLPVHVEAYILKNKPAYLVYGRQFFLVSIQELQFIVVQTAENEHTTLIQYESQYKKIFETEGLKSVFLFEKMTAKQQESFINKGIPFLSEKKQVFIPFLGFSLCGATSSGVSLSKEKMMAATQKVFLFLLYLKNEEVRCSLLGKKINLSPMSVSRACEQLRSMKLAETELRGRTGYIRPLYKGRELYNTAKDFLINPVQETLLISEQDLPENAIEAGESLLAKQTMLSFPTVPQFAVYKKNIKKELLHPQELRWSDTKGMAYLQLWKYEPELFLQNDVIDPVSLVCSLSEIFDERVTGEIEDLLEKFKW